jgi:pheromone shutdown protein TraB
MEIFINLWNNWTNIEKINTLSLYLSLLILLPLLVKIVTKNNKLVIFSILSLLSSALITLLGITFLSVAFNYTITYIFLLTPIIVIFVNLLNVGSSIGYYQLNKRNKNFNMNDLKENIYKIQYI